MKRPMCHTCGASRSDTTSGHADEKPGVVPEAQEPFLAEAPAVGKTSPEFVLGLLRTRRLSRHGDEVFGIGLEEALQLGNVVGADFESVQIARRKQARVRTPRHPLRKILQHLVVVGVEGAGRSPPEVPIETVGPRLRVRRAAQEEPIETEARQIFDHPVQQCLADTHALELGQQRQDRDLTGVLEPKQ